MKSQPVSIRPLDSEPFLGWPGWDHLRYFALLAMAQALWFGLIFGGTDRFTARHSFRVRIHLEVEPTIPFVPVMVIVYMSLYLLFSGAPFILRTHQQLRALAVTLAAVTLCAGVCFLLLPGKLAYPPPRELGK